MGGCFLVFLVYGTERDCVRWGVRDGISLRFWAILVSNAVDKQKFNL